MGSYNRVLLQCCSCQAEIEVQSKGGTCNLKTYIGSAGVPVADVGYIEGDIHRCGECGAQNRIVAARKMVKLETTPVEEDYDDA